MLFDDYPAPRDDEEEEGPLDLQQRLVYGMLIPSGMFLFLLVTGMLIPPINIVFYLIAVFLKCDSEPFAPFILALPMQGAIVLFMKGDRGSFMKRGMLTYAISIVLYAIIYPAVPW